MIRRIIALAGLALGVFFVLYGLITVYDNLMPFERMWETPVVRPHEQPIPSLPKGVVPFSGGEAVLRATPAEELEPPYAEANATVLQSGKTGYSYYCVHCHGKRYDGMATVGQSFSPLPTDLRSKQVQGLSLGEMFRSISFGVPGGGRQPPLHATISVERRWHIVSFIRSLGRRDTGSSDLRKEP